MKYFLKNKDDIVCEFDFLTENALSAKGEISQSEKISNTIIRNYDLLPLSFNKNIALDDAMKKWIENRKAPSNRQFIEKIKETYQDDSLMATINISFGLSLNDAYWVIQSDKDFKWKDFNLYDNIFDKALELVAFLGYSHKVSGYTSSPEYTTNGMLKKCWHRDENNDIELLKGQSNSYANGGREAYCEFYMSQIASALNFNHIDYDIKKFHNEIVSSCKAFTNKDKGYIPIYCLLDEKAKNIGKENFEDLEQIYGKENFEDLMLFDALICNTDRHLGNFGMIVDNNTNKILYSAPIFDNGLCFVNLLTKDDFKDINKAISNFKSYFDISFDEQLKLFAKKRHIKNLSNLTDFKFTRHELYNLDDDILKDIEKFIRNRSVETIKYIYNSDDSDELDNQEKQHNKIRKQRR